MRNEIHFIILILRGFLKVLSLFKNRLFSFSFFFVYFYQLRATYYEFKKKKPLTKNQI